MNFTTGHFILSGRSMDGIEELGAGFKPQGELEFALHAFPKGRGTQHFAAMSWEQSYAYLGVTPYKYDGLPIDKWDGHVISARDVVLEGLNEKGLACGGLTLKESQFEKPGLDPRRNLVSFAVCKWGLEQFSTVDEVQAAIRKVHVILPPTSHYVFTDASGRSLVLEWLEGKRQEYVDHNDEGETGFGILTNDPAYEWQVESVKHLKWKMGLARSAVAIPGGFYPDERFQRIWFAKRAMETDPNKPSTHQEAVGLVTEVLNTVAVPHGGIYAADASSTKPGQGDFTQFQIVRDHKDPTMFFRTAFSPSWRRARIADLGLGNSTAVRTLAPLNEGPWYIDAAAEFRSADSSLV